jgi:MarR family 2-MHQ and catechol resistance regulon transcriptional repressor
MSALVTEFSQDKRAIYYRTQIRTHGQKYAHFHWPSKEVFLTFIYTYHRLGETMEDLFNQHGLSRASFNALMILSRSASKGCIQQELSQLLLVSRANVTGIVNGLVRQELASRNEHPGDRRAYIVKISKKGEEVLDVLVPQYNKKEVELLSCLDASQKKCLKSLLEQIQEGIQKDRNK